VLIHQEKKKEEVEISPCKTQQDAEYWKLMYEELEIQMKNMMEMTLELIDKEVKKREHELLKGSYKKDSVPKDLEKELKRLQLFEHRIRVTWIGKLALAYIKFKRKLRMLIKGK